MAERNIIVWTAEFSGDNVHLSPHEAIQTENRVRILGGGTFRSDLYAKPADVNRSPIEALTKLQKIIDDDARYAAWLTDRNARRQSALDAQLAQNMGEQ